MLRFSLFLHINTAGRRGAIKKCQQAVLALLLLCPFYAQSKPIELVFWHAMAGHLGEEVQSLADAFNQSQDEYILTPVYKGDYKETLTSFAAAFRAHQPPDIVQVFEVATALMLTPKGIIKPVHELMHDHQVELPADDFIQSVREFYSEDGQLMAMPFNLSAPVLYYNKDALAKVGYNSSNFPKTWDEIELLAKKLKASGYTCTYTSAYPSWILIESYLAVHGLPLVQTPSKAAFDSPQLRQHFKRLQRWQQLRYFKYGGRVDDATVLFTSGVCPLFSQSSGAYNSLTSLVPFHLGVSVMPLDTQTSQHRYANTAGGAALWAVAGRPTSHYKGIAQFFAFIARPEVQKRWHDHTGYLPIGLKGIYASLLTGKHPVLLLARTDLEDAEVGNYMTHHTGAENQIRMVNDETLEALFSGLMTADEAMEHAIIRSNHVLLRFARNVNKSSP